MNDAPIGGRVLLTGATGYVGGRLLSRLEDAGCSVRCLARDPRRLEARVGPRTEVVAGDVCDQESLLRAMEGVEAAYYLVHSMSSSGSFEERDRMAARGFAAAAASAGVRRIIYLGGLGDDTKPLSPHLRSRHEVGALLASTAVPVVEIRCSIIIGSGSLSFELVRALVERLPVMITPRWVRVPTQPVSIGDVLEFLLRALTISASGHSVFEVGSPEPVTYAGLMEEYGRQRGLRRIQIPVPFLTTGLSSLWLGLVTPLYARVGRKLIDSLPHPMLVRDRKADSEFEITPMTMRHAIESALRNEDREFAETRWSDSVSSSGLQPGWGGVRFGNRIVDSHSVVVQAPPERAFAPIRRIGGKTGWYYAGALWRLRGFLDLLAGGVGIRRGRRDPEHLMVGDALDWWRVEEYDPPQRLRLAAEMKLPGRAWLQFDVTPWERGSRVTMTAVFDPLGVAGLAYWYALYPVHQLVFGGMLRRIAALSGE